jgi:hypothetical protein
MTGGSLRQTSHRVSWPAKIRQYVARATRLRAGRLRILLWSLVMLIPLMINVLFGRR